MRELKWGIRQARIWFDDVPQWTYAAKEIAECSLFTSKKQENNQPARRIVVEMLRPISGRSYYGALGALFVPQQTNEIKVQILASENPGKIVYNTLAHNKDTTYIGLPQEYVPALLRDITHFQGTLDLGPGTLSFDHAIHGIIGSSILFFRVIAYSLIRLLGSEIQSFTDEDLILLLEDEFNSRK